MFDPNYKHWYFQGSWDTDRYQRAMQKLEQVVCYVLPSVVFRFSDVLKFDNYYGTTVDAPSEAPMETEPTKTSRGRGLKFLQDSVRSFQKKTQGQVSPRDELEEYLKASIEEVEDPVLWWGVSDSEFHL